MLLVLRSTWPAALSFGVFMFLEVDFSGWQDHLEEKGVAGGVADVAKTTATKLESGKHTILCVFYMYGVMVCALSGILLVSVVSMSLCSRES